MAEDVQTHIHTCERCLRFKQPQERAEMQPILVSNGIDKPRFPYIGRKDQRC